LELLAFNAQKIKGHVTPPPFREFSSGVMSGLCLQSCVPNLKFTSLAGVATLHRMTLNRTTVKRRQFIGRQLTGVTVNRSDK